MATLTKAFTGTGSSAVFTVPDQKKFSLTVTGTFVGTWVLEQSDTNGDAWNVLVTGTSTQALTAYMSRSKTTNNHTWYRVRCAAYTSGTITAVLADVSDTIQEVKNDRGVTVFKITDDGIETTAHTIGGDTAVTLTGAQTLTNKTLTSPTLTTPTITGLTLPAAGLLQTAVMVGDDALTTSRETNVAGLSSAITLCTELLTDYAAHVADQGASAGEHKALHTAGALASAVAPTTLAELITRTNDLQTKYALHNTDAVAGTPTYHIAQETAHALANATAVTTLQTALTKLNDIKAKYNLHEADSTGHRTGSLHTTTSSDAAYGVAIVITATGALANDLVVWSILDSGTGTVKGVSAVAGTDTLTFTFSADPQNNAIISYLCIPVGR